MKTVIAGINWGDEGKGRMVDLLAAEYDIVIRYQGGNNAGHTVINDRGHFILNLLPSGILRPETVNIMGPGMVIDLKHLAEELGRLEEAGIEITPERFLISSHAIICLPYHKQQDIMEEERLAAARFGSTRRGIAPSYGDKYMKKSLRMEDLLATPEYLRERIHSLVEWKNIITKGYNQPPIEAEEILAWIAEYGAKIKPYIMDTGRYLQRANERGRSMLFEAQLGALRDIDFGIYPFTTSSNTIAAYAPIGAGLPGLKYDRVVGVIKAYSSCVGAGPFTAEFHGAEAETLREAGSEYGAATGRPRRVGPLDMVASAYGIMAQGATELALTKMDILTGMESIPVCTAYDIDGEQTKHFPSGEDLLKAKPVFEYLPGFYGQDISHCRKEEELPKAARDYVDYVEQTLNVPIKYVSVGAEREAIIIR